MTSPVPVRDDLLHQIHSTPEDQKSSPEFAARLNDLAVLYQAESRFREAEGLYRQSASILEQTLGPTDVKVAQSLSNRASLYRLHHELHEAERLFQIALRIWNQKGWPQPELPPQDSGIHMLWADHVERGGTLRNYRRSVRDLRSRVEARSDEARDELSRTIRDLGPWYHNLNFGGIETNPPEGDYPARRWQIFEKLVPNDLRGKTVLDIGCNSGFLSMEMKKRGAERVIATDFMPHLLAQTRFASYWFDQEVEPVELNAYDVESLGLSFDYVVFVGVLYHLKHPLYALEKVASVCRETLLFQSLMRGSMGDFTPADNYAYDDDSFLEDPNFPRMYFLEKSFNSDESNWWIANRSCLKAMLRVAGFTSIRDTSAPDHFVCKK
jgi:tRNA (mo5U34)-methyltransferase